jgi:hypothetical protein
MGRSLASVLCSRAASSTLLTALLLGAVGCKSRTVADGAGSSAGGEHASAPASDAPEEASVGAEPSVSAEGAQKTPALEPTLVTLKTGVGPTRVDLIPSAATMVAHVDLAALASAPLWIENLALMSQEPDTRRALAAMRRCGLPFDGLRALDIGVEPRGEHLAVIISGAGVGARANLECLGRELPEQLGARTWRFEQVDGGGERLLLGGGADGELLRARLVDADTIALSTESWAAAIERRVRAPAKESAPGTLRLRVGALAPALTRIDARQHIWFAGILPAVAVSELRAQGLEGIEDVGGALDLSDGLTLTLTVRAASADRAATMSTLARTQLTNVTPLARASGVPDEVLESVAVDVSGAVIELRGALTMKSIRAVRAALNERSSSKGAPAP